MTNGPVVSNMLVFSDLMKEYSSGVYWRSDNDVIELVGGHAVLLTGFGENYWIVKSSWGKEWGEDGGYFRIRMGDCYIADESYDGVFTCTPEMQTTEFTQ